MISWLKSRRHLVHERNEAISERNIACIAVAEAQESALDAEHMQRKTQDALVAMTKKHNAELASLAQAAVKIRDQEEMIRNQSTIISGANERCAELFEQCTVQAFKIADLERKLAQTSAGRSGRSLRRASIGTQ